MEFELQKKPLVVARQQPGDGILMGSYLDGDEALPVVNGRIILPFDLFTTHIAMLGTTGSGKTTTARVIFEGVGRQRRDAQIFFFDGNGDLAMAQVFGESLSPYGGDLLFFPQEPFDGWAGSWQAVFNRFLLMIPFAEQGGAAYFSDVETVILQRACRMYGEPPQSYDDLMERLDYTELRRVWGSESLRGADSELVDALKVRIESVFTHVGKGFDGPKSFKDVRGGYFALSPMSMGKSSVTAMRMMLSQLAYYIEFEKDPEQFMLVMLDEFAAFASGVEIGPFIEQARKRNVCVVVMSQTVRGLGDPTQVLRILENAGVIFGHNSAAWIELERFIGSEEVADVSWRFDAIGQVESEIVKLVERTKVRRSQFLSLLVGQAWVLRHNDAMLMQVDLPRQRRGLGRRFVLPEAQELFDVPTVGRERVIPDLGIGVPLGGDLGIAASPENGTAASSPAGGASVEGPSREQDAQAPPATTAGAQGGVSAPSREAWEGAELQDGPDPFDYAKAIEKDPRANDQ